MRKKTLILLLAASLLAGNTTFADSNEQSWLWQREIKSDETARFNSFEISPEIYAKSDLQLWDLRIGDDKGSTVPYILDTQRTVTETVQDTTGFSLNKTFRKNNNTSFDFQGRANEGTDLLLNSLRADLDYQGEFFKYVELYGSHDGTHWDWISNDTLYRVEGYADDGLSLNAPQTYTFYRITILDNIENINLTGLTGSLISASEELSKKKIILSPDQYSRTENGTTTEIRLKGYRNLPVRALSIDGEGLFHRPCRVVPDGENTAGITFGSGYLYQSTLKGPEPLKNAMPVEISQPYDTLVLMIVNNDNPPLKIGNITLEYSADTLIFEPEAGRTYFLQYGNAFAIKPQYDLEQFKNEIALQKIGTAVLMTETKIEPKKSTPAASASQKNIFSAVIFLVALLLGWLAVRGMKKAPY